MAFIKQSWEQIQTLMSRLGPTEKGLIASLFIILLFVGAVLLQYAGKPEHATLSSFAGQNAEVVLAKLKQRGIDATMDGGQLRVPRAQRDEAIAMMGQMDMLSGNLSQAFDEYIKEQSPWISSAQRDQAFMITKQKVLSQVISRMRGVKSAVVMIDKPRQDRLTRPVRPTASVSVYFKSGYMIDQALVRSIAGMVSGAVADMNIVDVTVIDASNGGSYKVKTGLDGMIDESLDIIRKREHLVAEKVQRLLHYIPGVMVAVSVRNDTRGPGQVAEYQRDTESLVSERSENYESKSQQDAGRAGARANTESEIGPSSKQGNEQTRNSSTTEYGNKPIKKEERYRDAGHKLKQINITVSVPKSFFKDQYQRDNPDADPADAATIDSLAATELQKIKESLEPHTEIETEPGVFRPGVVKAVLFDDGARLAQMEAAKSQGGGMGDVLQSEWMRSLGLGAMALAAMMLMLTMTKKATEQPDLPSAEQLAGVPPTLPSDDELIGEAEESAHTMAGMELDEDELEHRKVVEQISELITTNPEEAAMILRKWVRVDD